MSRPSFQFYPGDWRKNANLGRCSKAARGAWIDVLCVLHDSDEYGVARYPLRELANASSCPPALLRELVDKDVLKGADADGTVAAFVYVPRSGRKDGAPVTLIPEQSGPLWYSSRMVKDEHVRHVRGEGTRFGDEDGPSPKRGSKAAPKPPKGDGPSSSSSSSASAKEIAPAELAERSISTAPPPPAAFDGLNADALNGKAVVALAPGWELPEAWGLDAVALGWKPPEVLTEAEKFRQYWTSGKGAGTRRAVKGWRQTWSNWLGKAAERRR